MKISFFLTLCLLTVMGTINAAPASGHRQRIPAVAFPDVVPIDYEIIRGLRLGMSKKDVEKVLGEKIWPKANAALWSSPQERDKVTDRMQTGLDFRESGYFGPLGRLLSIMTPALRTMTFAQAEQTMAQLGVVMPLDKDNPDYIDVPSHMFSDQYQVCLAQGGSLTLRAETYRLEQPKNSHGYCATKRMPALNNRLNTVNGQTDSFDASIKAEMGSS